MSYNLPIAWILLDDFSAKIHISEVLLLQTTPPNAEFKASFFDIAPDILSFTFMILVSPSKLQVIHDTWKEVVPLMEYRFM